MKSIERKIYVAFSPFQMSLQVFYDSHYLYIFAPDNDCRQKWVRALKDGNHSKQYTTPHRGPFIVSLSTQAFCLLFLLTETKNNNLVTKYHPNFWMEGKWRCCQQTEKLAAGCQVYDPLGFSTCCFVSLLFI